MVKRTLIYIISFLIFILPLLEVEKINADEKVFFEPKNERELLSYLEKEWRGLFYSFFGNPEVIDFKNRIKYKINLSEYTTKGIVYYGNHNDVKKATYVTQNHYNKGQYRFLGIGAISSEIPYSNFDYPDDYKSLGDVLNRKYITYPYNNRQKIKNSYIPIGDNFNNPVVLRELMMLSGKDYTNKEVVQYLNYVAMSVHDQYAERKGINNQFHTLGTKRTKEIIYTLLPPTLFTRGQASIWHYTVHGTLYDNHLINPLKHVVGVDNNFKATKLDIKQVTSNTYEIYLSVKNDSKKSVNTNVPLPTQVKIKIGNNKPIVYNIEAHEDSFTNNQTKVGFLGDFKVNNSVKPNTKITVEAMYNPNKEKDFREISYNDNTIKKSVYTPKNQMCNVNGSGETDTYTLKTCTKWDNEGKCITKGNTYHNISLKHEASVEFNKDKQALQGVWTRYGNHTSDSNKNVPKATGTNIKADKWNVPIADIPENQFKNYGINNQMVKSLNELDVKDNQIRKLLRAGRPIELYGTVEVNLSIMSFKGTSDINKRKDRFMNDFIKSLELEGVKVADGIVKNYNGDSEVSAQVDKDRTKSGNYITTNSSSVSKTVFGNSKKVTRYQQNFSFIIPIESVNKGGEQETGQGSLGDDYEVGNSLNSFYTNIKTSNGMHGVRFSVELDGSKFDPYLKQSEVCYSTTEKFKVDGNIYDDVGSEDVKDEVDFGKHNDEWDF